MSMNIGGKKGDKITVTKVSIDNGYAYDKFKANTHLKIGGIYTIEKCVIHGWNTDVYIQEFPNEVFNSVTFEDYEKKGSMLEKLDVVLTNLRNLLVEKADQGAIHTLLIDYHAPVVRRIWFQHDDLRIYLHKIETAGKSEEALYHPHEWDSAMYIAKGPYEMGVGHSSTNELIHTDCKLILPAGTKYEMTEKDAWHYVNPLTTSYTVMITGELNGREMPLKPTIKLTTRLWYNEILDIFLGVGLENSAENRLLAKQIATTQILKSTTL